MEQSSPPTVSQQPSQPVTPAQPSAPAKKNWLKWVVIITLLVFAAVAYGLILSQKTLKLSSTTPTPTIIPSPTSTPDPTANWKTYMNTQYGFSLRYPTTASIGNELAVYESTPASGSPFTFHMTLAYKDTDSALLSLRYYISSKSLSIWWQTEGSTEYTKRVTEFANSISPKQQVTLPTFQTEEKTLNGMPVLIAKGRVEAGQGSGNLIITILQHDKGIFVIEQPDLTANPVQQTMSDQILSTFTFIDQSQAVDTSNWKTYINPRYGYSVKYPPGLIIEESNDPQGNIDTTTISNYSGKDFSSGNIDPDDSNVFLMWIINPWQGKTTLEEAKKNMGVPGVEVQDYMVGGIKGFKVLHGDVVVVYNNKRYDFQLRNEKSKYRNYFDQVLSTFKFTK